MKALVLAGGSGVRLRPFTHSMPKQLFPIANRPVLFYGLEAIGAAGVHDVGVVVGDHAEAIRQAVGDGASFGLKITYIRQDLPLGLAHCVSIARDFLADEDFVMYLGDNVIGDGVEPIVSAFGRTRPAARVMLGKVGDPRRFGVAEVGPDGRVLRLAEKPAVPRSDLAMIGAYVFSPAVHEAIAAIEPSERGEREITDALSWLVAHDHVVEAHVSSGYWQDTGTFAGVLDCNRAMLGAITPAVLGSVDDASELIGPVVVEENATVSRSRVIGPAVIGSGATVSESRIGPYTSIGAKCTVNRSVVENSIILGGSSLHGIPGMRDSLIGRDADVRRAETPGPCSLILGDHSSVAPAV
ncbi:glucose-1-phosphate thymidylyltransferase [Actinoallomurus iriomotensis]|uniref:Glucose-1-phosphate thymidylyltransferase n=1 Tax=Actinoallomurus iriomotensis TaxID=478107 RepID=A0A9W6VQ41_9ACTN|nr:glucose-1-phosphate thymidylyltransferase [Actinoallomurus iriomotensis]GLY75489.1 glucose-1-phosphate thymidylyltransferase [Actinoallomurus iriomotensis]